MRTSSNASNVIKPGRDKVQEFLDKNSKIIETQRKARLEDGKIKKYKKEIQLLDGEGVERMNQSKIYNDTKYGRKVIPKDDY